MFNETSGPPTPATMVYHRQNRRQKKACCASCAQKGLSGLSGCGCAPMEVIVIQEPTSDTQSTTTGDLPGWVWLVALGLGALLIFK